MPTPACRVLEGPPEALEIRLLLEGIRRRYGYDFLRHDARFVAARVRSFVKAEGLPGVAALQERILRDPACLERGLRAFSLEPAPFFEPPAFHRVFRRRIAPLLRTYPSLRFWQIGSPSGAEAASLLVLLQDEGLLARSLVYVTDPHGAPRAEPPGFPGKAAAGVAAAYRRAGGAGDMDDHFEPRGDRRVLRPALLRRLVPVPHSLVSDGSFNEFQAIVARGVLALFDVELQGRVLDLLDASLVRLGFLVLGPRERLEGTPHERRYRPLSRRDGIYRKVSS